MAELVNLTGIILKRNQAGMHTKRGHKNIKYLNIWVQVHEGPFAIFTVDAERKLYLFVEHHKDPHSLLLSGNKEGCRIWEHTDYAECSQYLLDDVLLS